MGKHPASDIDVSSRKRHGIDDRTVENRESYRSIAKLLFGCGPPEVTGCENPVANFRNIALQLRVALKTGQRGDFLSAFLADLGFLVPGIAEKALLSSGGNDIRGAAHVKQRRQSQGESSEHYSAI